MSGDHATAGLARLPRSRAAAGRGGFGPLRHRAVTGSTNDDLAAEARAGSVEPAILVVDHQIRGRGRRDRRWEDTGAEALLFSLRLPLDRIESHDAVACLAAAARAAADAACPEPVVVKWPNDLVVEEGPAPGKLAGLLAELVTGPPGAVVVGLGVNLGPVPGQPGATSLRECGAEVERDSLLAEIVDGFVLRRPDPAAARAELVAHSATVGRMVRVDLGSSSFVGSATGITADGRLVVATESGARTVSAADVVHLRSPGPPDADL